MALQKLVPTGGLAAQRSGIQSAAVADVVDGRIAQLESEIVQGTHDALAAAGWIFLEQFDHEFLQRRIEGWSTDGVGPGKGPLLGDQDTKPTEQGIVSGVTRVANLPRRRRPTRLALRASRMRWASVKRLGFPPSCSRRIRFSSWRYSMTACWCRLIQPATAMSRNWSCVVTAWRIFQKSLWLHLPSDLG